MQRKFKIYSMSYMLCPAHQAHQNLCSMTRVCGWFDAVGVQRCGHSLNMIERTTLRLLFQAGGFAMRYTG